jgi:Transposase IS4
VEELYADLGILIYMGLHPENDIDQYWCVDINNQPSHGPVRTAMARDRWKQISRAFHISNVGESAFAKVCNYLIP